MPQGRLFGNMRLVNGSTGDPVLLIDYPGRNDALLLDAGDNSALTLEQLADLRAVFISHHHVDHFIGLDRIVRANIDADKTVSIYGPVGTIRKVYDRIMSYEYPFFPFQKIVLDVVEITDETIRSARLDCGLRFPEPVIVEIPRAGATIFETETVAVDACSVDHTVPCLSYAVTERPGLYLDTAAIRESGLTLGPWAVRALQQLRAGMPVDTPLQIAGRQFSGQEIADRFVARSEGARVVFITDTALSPAVRPRLLQLATGAARLYCDSFYLDAQIAAAEKYRHTTARQAAEFARDAAVGELVLIHFASRYAGRYDLLVDEARAIFANTRAEISSAGPPGNPLAQSG